MKYILATAVYVSLSIMVANAATVFDIADTENATFEHDSNGTNSPSPIPAAGSQVLNTGTFSWGNLTSDTTPNTAVFSAGNFAASDWGGTGTFASNSIDVSNLTTVDVSVQFDGLFNAGGEFSNFFYQLDGGPAVSFGVGVATTTYTNESVSVANLDVSSVTNLVVGFAFNHDGASDLFAVDSFTVTAMPEPSAALLGSLGLLGLLRRRR